MADHTELYQQIGQVLVDELTDEWESVEVVCYMVTIVTEFRGTIVRPNGERASVSLPVAQLFLLFEELREVTYEPGKGAWFTATFRMDATGRFSVDFDYDSKPDLRPEPLDETWLDDLEQYPRDPELIPAWMPRPVG
ncbi:immunity protein YezG family protein [Actinopolymorpha alba]|uniref:immunity protein YezG family protein n=1 Tax=Actinopolymorpha alba TaxID=533267 RepID=UPI000363A177|nr:immunity protein YezG family protein [Actinopolymorpha alba]